VTASGAANTLWWNDSNELYADNTDGLGLIWDLERLSLVLKGARVLLLGAGGAAAGILPSLLKEKPQKIYVANRTIERAHELVARQESIFFSCLKAVLFEENYSEPMDLVLHATSLGHQGRTPDLSETALGEKTVCYDLSYGDSAKPFLRWARERGVLYCAEGIGMLVAQAAEQFERWNGKRPNVLEALNEINLLLSSGMG
jgi:shikimate dehydrogenase